MENTDWQTVVSLIIDWYRKMKRDLPWRADASPYHVWLSETMLQQTRIETVIPYYFRFLEELPSIQDLAQADDEKLMKLWEGLGYYSRVRNLKKAAQTVVASYGGKLPETVCELQKLSGIGDYTAGAIASIAFGQPEPAVDGNVLRVAARLSACREDVTQPKMKKTVTQILKQVYPSGQAASDLTQGIMELGEVVCIPNGEAKCVVCPLNAVCRAYGEKSVEKYPVRSAKKQRKVEERTVFLLFCGGKIALRRRENSGLLAGMWEFPHCLGTLNAEQAKQLLAEWGISVASCTPCGKAKHLFSHIEWRMTGYQAECTAENERFEWKTAEEILRGYAVPSAFRFFVKQISETDG